MERIGEKWGMRGRGEGELHSAEGKGGGGKNASHGKGRRRDAELAAAVLLVVEGIIFQELVAAVLKTTLAPVLCPEEGGGDGGLGRETCLGDLVEAFPTGRGEGGGEVGDS